MSQSEYSRSPQQHSRRRPIVALVIVVVLCLTAFSLGVFVGKQRQKIAGDVEPDSPVTHRVASKPDAVVDGEALVAQANKGVAVSVENVSTLAVGEETSVEAVVAAQDAVESVAPQQSNDPLAQLTTSIAKSPLGSGINSTPVMAKVAAVSDSTVILAVEKNTETVIVAELQKQVVASPVARVSTTGAVVYVVQVGSFQKRADAEKLQAKLQKDYTVLVRNVDLGAKGGWFRVLVGTSSTKKAAAQLKEQLQSRYRVSGFVKKTTL